MTFEIDRPAFTAGAMSFGDRARQMAEAEAKLAVGLSGEGRCWGSDDIGGEFEGSYSPQATSAFGTTAAHEKHLSGLSSALMKSVENVSTTDDESARALRNIK